MLTEPIENRIAYIKSDKPKDEQKTRLRLLKPIKGPLPDKMALSLANQDGECLELIQERDALREEKQLLEARVKWLEEGRKYYDNATYPSSARKWLSREPKEAVENHSS